MSAIFNNKFQKNEEVACPFWQAPKCKSVADTSGIFIPLEHHIKMYCESTQHTHCTQYAVNKDPQRDTEINRRQQLRIKSRHRVAVTHLNHHGNALAKMRDTETIDLSINGMCLRSNEPILKDSLVQFSLDESFTNVPISGLALSKWCLPSPEQDYYRIGFEFQNSETTRLMGKYIDSQIQPKI